MACLRDKFDNGVVLDGRYRTLAPLNHGSFGMVFKAQNIETGEEVAIKCLTKKAAADEQGYEFAVDDSSVESELHRLLGRHPNIVNLIETFETESHVYLVLEFCPRGDLYEAIRNDQGPLETEHVRRFMLELVDAIEFIHSKGIYHRDIKPENIFLSQSGAMKLGDFGLATRDEWSYEMTVGSDRYMSPEQYDSAGNGYSPAQADLWAIGICLLNILFSRNPFTTPTEADPIFLDFSRDKQCLFDVFPDMSQDTYDVIVECMSLDPTKRSLSGVREALRRVVSFTILDEALDDFCSTDHAVMASANREPLRTPSLQSPAVDNGVAFPWAKALQSTAHQHNRQLSAIPDNESYSEELFPKSEATTADWCSNITAETPSMDSVLDSAYGASMTLSSLAVTQPKAIPQSIPKVSPMAGSLPIAMPRPRATPAMSLVFGRKDAVSKSWSDLWDEEEEEEEERRRLESLRSFKAPEWTEHETASTAAADDIKPKLEKVSSRLTLLADNDRTPRIGLSPVTKPVKMASSTLPGKADLPALEDIGDMDDELLFSDTHEEDEKRAPAAVAQRRDLDSFLRRAENRPARAQPQSIHVSVHMPNPQSTPIHSTSKSPSSVDKWAVLGERRRGISGSSPSPQSRTKDVRPEQPFGRPIGVSANRNVLGVPQDHFQTGHFNNRQHSSNKQHLFTPTKTSTSYTPHTMIPNTPSKTPVGKENVRARSRDKESPVTKSRGWNWNWRRGQHTAVGWVGGW